MSGKFVYGADIHAVKEHSEDGVRIAESLTTLMSSILKVAIQPPLYKLFPNQVYREVIDAYQVRFDWKLMCIIHRIGSSTTKVHYNLSLKRACI